jgi:hypothetical protein
MLFSDHGQMVIDNLASLKIFVVEMHNGVSGLSHCWQEFFLDNFGVMSVTLCHVLHLQGLLGFHLLNSLISQTHEDLIISIGIEIIITIFTFFNLLLFLHSIHGVLLVHHLLSDLLCFVLDGFLHNHFVENVSCNLHALTGLSSSSVSGHYFMFRLLFKI